MSCALETVERPCHRSTGQVEVLAELRERRRRRGELLGDRHGQHLEIMSIDGAERSEDGDRRVRLSTCWNELSCPVVADEGGGNLTGDAHLGVAHIERSGGLQRVQRIAHGQEVPQADHTLLDVDRLRCRRPVSDDHRAGKHTHRRHGEHHQSDQPGGDTNGSRASCAAARPHEGGRERGVESQVHTLLSAPVGAHEIARTHRCSCPRLPRTLRA